MSSVALLRTRRWPRFGSLAAATVSTFGVRFSNSDIHTSDIVDCVVTAKPANETELPFGPLLQRDFGDIKQFFPAGAAG